MQNVFEVSLYHGGEGRQDDMETSEVDNREWMTYLFELLSRDQRNLVACAVWTIWTELKTFRERLPYKPVGMERWEIEIKGDSLTVVNKVDVIDKDRSAIGAYIEDIKALKGGFGRCKYIHVVKGSNGLAHILVIEGIKRGASSYSLGGVSKFVEMVVERDKRSSETRV
ncbi:hypothetical protein Godav_013477 [Gossypium davidsonii]|uniref:RNase H type-1 domain-containing protein n=1 Tax=Gossypium davidsonii TaxID=34287 RepID=A0A7J8RGT0_GOSDV|nr:hypothetical protein [Gossypium davidsonii]